MTMLDRMRRHQNWLKWSLGLVVLAFVIFYIPDFLRGTGAGAASSDTVAVVQGHEIRADEFRRVYRAQLQSYRAAYGGKMSERLLKQLGIDQQILQQMVDERASLAEAERLGLRASDEEVRQRILAIPSFQQNGVFIGEQRYQQLLRAQQPALNPADFEEDIRRAILVEKLKTSVTEWLTIPDRELEAEYRKRNDKIKLAVATLTAESFRSQVTVSDADVAAYFTAHAADFQIPEKRKVRYALVDLEGIRAKVVVPAADVERAYNDNIEQYSTPEQVRASHILLKTDGKDLATVKAQAEDVLKQARAGADFATLARKYSQDESNAKNGGDLDFFGRGRMVQEFDDAVFKMEPGQISDLVKTQFGFHIIKLAEKRPGTSKSIAEVRQQLTDQLAFERAQAQAADLAQTLQKEMRGAEDLDRVAKAHGLAVQESGFFARDEPILGLGASPEAAGRAFALKQGEVSSPIQTPRGIVFEILSGTQGSYAPKLDDVKERVREAAVLDRARALAREKAAGLAATLQKAPDFEKAAKAAGIDVKTTELIARDAPVGELGVATALTDAAFKIAQGGVTDAIVTDRGTAIAKVIEKQETTSAAFAGQKDTFREQLLNERKVRFFNAYMTKAKLKMKVDVNRQALERAAG